MRRVCTEPQVSEIFGDHGPDRTGDLQFRKRVRDSYSARRVSAPIKLRVAFAGELFRPDYSQFVTSF